jgi:chaperonin cofactor prefoldin
LGVDEQIKYIDKLKSEFDGLMNQKKELDAMLTRIPCKKANTNMVPSRERIEEELDTVEKKISSIKLELRKLRVI